MPDKDCYNYLLSVYIDSEDKELLIKIKRHFNLSQVVRNSVVYQPEINKVIESLTNYSDGTINNSLNKLIEIFDIRENVMRTGLSGFYVSGTQYRTGVI